MHASLKAFLATTCALLLTVALALPAEAGEGGKRGGKRGGKKGKHKIAKLFKRFDKDKSGSLTSDEVPAKLWERISKADANGDGAVTKAEIKAKRKERGGKKGGGKPTDG